MTTRKELLDTAICNYKFSMRTQRCFIHSSRCKSGVIKTLRDVTTRSGKELLEIQKLGKKTLDHIREVLAKDGLYLRGEEPRNHTREWPGEINAERVPDQIE